MGLTYTISIGRLFYLPNMIPFGFGAVPIKGAVADVKEIFAYMDNGTAMGVDLAPIYNVFLLLMANGVRSFHLIGEAAENTGDPT